MLRGIHHIVIEGQETSETTRFYRGVLSLCMNKRKKESEGNGGYDLYFSHDPSGDIPCIGYRNTSLDRKGCEIKSGISAIVLGIPTKSLDVWRAHLREHHATYDLKEIDRTKYISLLDPHGARLLLKETSSPQNYSRKPGGSNISLLSILDIESVEVNVRDVAETTEFLNDVMGFYELEVFQNHTILSPGRRNASGCLRLNEVPSDSRKKNDQSVIREVHWDATLENFVFLAKRLVSMDIPVIGFSDHQTFRSLSFRTPDGFIFGISTEEEGYIPASLVSDLLKSV